MCLRVAPQYFLTKTQSQRDVSFCPTFSNYPLIRQNNSYKTEQNMCLRVAPQYFLTKTQSQRDVSFCPTFSNYPLIRLDVVSYQVTFCYPAALYSEKASRLSPFENPHPLSFISISFLLITPSENTRSNKQATEHNHKTASNYPHVFS
ncbi:hypothetical protein J6590_015872 [Homalodisca vitripennis]|nr:hypothetical protein J6590_015872 [Homalodisca vitripennis]